MHMPHAALLLELDRKELPSFLILIPLQSCNQQMEPLDILVTLWLKKQTVRPSVVSQFHIYRDNSTTLNFEGTRSKYQMR